MSDRDEFLNMVRNTDDLYLLQDLGGMVGLKLSRLSRNEAKHRIATRLARKPDLDPFDEANWVEDVYTPTPGSDLLRINRLNGVGEYDGIDDETYEA